MKSAFYGKMTDCPKQVYLYEQMELVKMEDTEDKFMVKRQFFTYPTLLPEAFGTKKNRIVISVFTCALAANLFKNYLQMAQDFKLTDNKPFEQNINLQLKINK